MVFEVAMSLNSPNSYYLYWLKVSDVNVVSPSCSFHFVAKIKNIFHVKMKEKNNKFKNRKREQRTHSK